MESLNEQKNFAARKKSIEGFIFRHIMRYSVRIEKQRRSASSTTGLQNSQKKEDH